MHLYFTRVRTKHGFQQRLGETGTWMFRVISINYINLFESPYIVKLNTEIRAWLTNYSIFYAINKMIDDSF